jgi:hypothetical protein
MTRAQSEIRDYSDSSDHLADAVAQEREAQVRLDAEDFGDAETFSADGAD